MQRYLLLLVCLLWLGVKPAFAQSETPVPARSGASILSPLPGSALQGSVAIQGTLPVEGFQTAEVSFAYSGATAAVSGTAGWFPILSIAQPVSNGLLAQWDTTTISDGLYDLRLVLTRVDGSQETVTVGGLRVRNYSPIETDTPTPVLPTPTQMPEGAPVSTLTPDDTPLPSATALATQTPRPVTPTPLPSNPAQMSTADVWVSLEKGVLATLGIFSLIGLYALLRSLLTRG